MKRRALPKEFYREPTLRVAQNLLGKLLCRKEQDLILRGKIVEVEAYLGRKDPASHSYRGKTQRNAVMFGQTGCAYVYFTYGNHYCVNVVTGTMPGEAVLIRAVEPIDGISKMEKRRKTDRRFNLCSGPGKLTQAFGIDLKLNGESLRGNKLWIEEGIKLSVKQIDRTTRIGISKGTRFLYRFTEKNSLFTSKKMSGSSHHSGLIPQHRVS